MFLFRSDFFLLLPVKLYRYHERNIFLKFMLYPRCKIRFMKLMRRKPSSSVLCIHGRLLTRFKLFICRFTVYHGLLKIMSNLARLLIWSLYNSYICTVFSEDSFTNSNEIGRHCRGELGRWLIHTIWFEPLYSKGTLRQTHYYPIFLHFENFV